MSIKILYIEDNPLNMRLVRKMLTDTGYLMLEATDACTGLSIAINELPHIILLDINLPDMDGLELARVMKATFSLRHIPIIALTANVMAGDREYCLKAGCDGYLPKPITRIELKALLERFAYRRNQSA